MYFEIGSGILPNGKQVDINYDPIADSFTCKVEDDDKQYNLIADGQYGWEDLNKGHGETVRAIAQLLDEMTTVKLINY
jgi:hypothetical protein